MYFSKAILKNSFLVTVPHEAFRNAELSICIGLKIGIGNRSYQSALALRVISLAEDFDLDGNDFQVGYFLSADVSQWKPSTHAGT